MALTSTAGKSLAAWHAMVATKDLAQLESIVGDEAVFRSPVANSPYPGKKLVCIVLRGAFQVFEDFAYHREFVHGDRDVCLEFSARILDKRLKGVDLIKFAEDGKICEFEVLVRPATGLQALGAAMGAAVGALVKSELEVQG